MTLDLSPALFWHRVGEYLGLEKPHNVTYAFDLAYDLEAADCRGESKGEEIVLERGGSVIH